MNIQEQELHQLVRRYPSHVLLRWVAAVSPNEGTVAPSTTQFELMPFVAAKLAELAIYLSNPDRGQNPTEAELWELTRRIQGYLLSDPIGHDREISEAFHGAEPIFALVRMVAPQWKANVNTYGRAVRSLVLFQKMARQLALKSGRLGFDFDHEFERIFSVPLDALIKVALVAHSVAIGRSPFTGGYFEKARRSGMMLPTDQVILAALDLLVADPARIRETHDLRRNKDRRFAMYDYNALFSYPIIRPFKSDRMELNDHCRLIAPLPGLITYKITTGLYHELKQKLGRPFTRWFGYVFEAYIGELLLHSTAGTALFSEADIRTQYPESSGKVCDWLVLDGNTCILIECKATEFYQDLLPVCDPAEFQRNLQRTLEGLVQLHSFQQAIMAKAPGLERFYHVTRVLPILVTLEPLYLLNAPIGRGYVDDRLATEGVSQFPWRLYDMQILEILQPHLAAGFGFSAALDLLSSMPEDSALEQIIKSTGRAFGDSYLNPTLDEVLRELGVPR